MGAAALLAQSLAVAAFVWGQPACGHVGAEVRPLSGVQQGAAAEAVIGGEADPIHGIPACTMILAPRVVLTRTAWQRQALCSLVVHEWGHISGQRHSSDPNNVMYDGHARPYWRCSDRWRPVFAALELEVGP